MPTTLLVVPGNWASVKGGKWHLLPGTWVEPDGLLGAMTSLCGVTFTPLNVTGGEAPPTNDYWICARCAKAEGRAE
jgi:hypothetical protein